MYRQLILQVEVKDEATKTALERLRELVNKASEKKRLTLTEHLDDPTAYHSL